MKAVGGVGQLFMLSRLPGSHCCIYMQIFLCDTLKVSQAFFFFLNSLRHTRAPPKA